MHNNTYQIGHIVIIGIKLSVSGAIGGGDILVAGLPKPANVSTLNSGFSVVADSKNSKIVLNYQSATNKTVINNVSAISSDTYPTPLTIGGSYVTSENP